MSNRRDSAFTPKADTPASRIGTRMRAHRPFVVGLTVWAVELVVLALALVGFGLLLVHVLLPAGVGRLDTNVANWFVDQRTPTLERRHPVRVGSRFDAGRRRDRRRRLHRPRHRETLAAVRIPDAP